MEDEAAGPTQDFVSGCPCGALTIFTTGGRQLTMI